MKQDPVEESTAGGWVERPLAPADEVTAILALPDGKTVMTTTGPRTGHAAEPKIGAPMRHATVVLLDEHGEVLWRVENERAVSAKSVASSPVLGL